MPLFKRYVIVSKVYSISKALGDKATAYSANSGVTKKKFRDKIPTLFRTG